MSDEDKRDPLRLLSVCSSPAVRRAKRAEELVAYLLRLRESYSLRGAHIADWERPTRFGMDVLDVIEAAQTVYFTGKMKAKLARAPFGETAKEEAAIVAALKAAGDACLAANKALEGLEQVAGGVATPRLKDALWEKRDEAQRQYSNIGLAALSGGRHVEALALPGVLLDVFRFQSLLIAEACDDAARRSRPAGRPTTDKAIVADALVEALRCFLLQMPTTKEAQGLADLLFGKGNLDVKQAVTEAYRDIRPEEIEACLRRRGLEPEAISDKGERQAAIREAFRSAYRHGKRKGKGAVGDRLDAILTPELMDKLYRHFWPD